MIALFTITFYSILYICHLPSIAEHTQSSTDKVHKLQNLWPGAFPNKQSLFTCQNTYCHWTWDLPEMPSKEQAAVQVGVALFFSFYTYLD